MAKKGIVEISEVLGVEISMEKREKGKNPDRQLTPTTKYFGSTIKLTITV